MVGYPYFYSNSNLASENSNSTLNSNSNSSKKKLKKRIHQKRYFTLLLLSYNLIFSKPVSGIDLPVAEGFTPEAPSRANRPIENKKTSSLFDTKKTTDVNTRAGKSDRPKTGSGPAKLSKAESNGPQKNNGPAKVAKAESLPEIRNRINEDKRLVKAADKAGKDMSVQRDFNKILKEVAQGNTRPGVGPKHVFKDVYEHRTKNGARVYYRELKGINGTTIEILGQSSKVNQGYAIDILKQNYR